MKPTNFKQSNKTWYAPSDGGEVMGNLNTYQDPHNPYNSSKWTATLKERISFLFHGTIWLTVVGNVHPPVEVVCKEDIFADKETKTEKWISITAHILTALFITAMVYVILSVVVGNFNPSEWTYVAKFLLLLVLLLMLIRNRKYARKMVNK